MAQLVSIEFVKAALRVDHSDDDFQITGYIDAVTEAVLRYLRTDGTEWTEETVPVAVRQSIVLGVHSLYEPEELDLLSGLASSDPKSPLVALLCMMRKPTYA